MERLPCNTSQPPGVTPAVLEQADVEAIKGEVLRCYGDELVRRALSEREALEELLAELLLGGDEFTQEARQIVGEMLERSVESVARGHPVEFCRFAT